MYILVEKIHMKLTMTIRSNTAKSSLRSSVLSVSSAFQLRGDREQNGATFLAQAQSFFPPRVIHMSAGVRVPRQRVSARKMERAY